MKQEIYRSDIIAFFIIIAGYICSFFHIVSKIFNIPIPKHSTAENPDEAHANTKIRVYHAIAETTPSPLSNTDDVKKKGNKEMEKDKKKDKKKKKKNNDATQQV